MYFLIVFLVIWIIAFSLYFLIYNNLKRKEERRVIYATTITLPNGSKVRFKHKISVYNKRFDLLYASPTCLYGNRIPVGNELSTERYNHLISMILKEEMGIDNLSVNLMRHLA